MIDREGRQNRVRPGILNLRISHDMKDSTSRFSVSSPVSFSTYPSSPSWVQTAPSGALPDSGMSGWQKAALLFVVAGGIFFLWGTRPDTDEELRHYGKPARR